MRASHKIEHQAAAADTAGVARDPEKRAPTLEQQWLNMQCQMLQDVLCGWLFEVSPDSRDAHIKASWPRLTSARIDMLHKVLTCAGRDRAFREEAPAEGRGGDVVRLYKPITAGQQKLVLVLELESCSDEQRRSIANVLRWNIEWLKYALVSVPHAGKRDLGAVFALSNAILEQSGFKATATTLVSELAARYLCQRVSLGLRRGQRIAVEIVSHSARFKQEANLVQEIGAAMCEAADQDRTVVFPPPDGTPPAITHAHRQLARQGGDGAVCTILMSDGEKIVGALCLERETPETLDPAALQQIEQLLAVITPSLWLRHEEEKPLVSKLWGSLKGFTMRLFGPAHIRLKLFVLTAVLLVAFFSVARGEWRITADAVVEGSVQRTIAAPIDGYIASADARPGDLVKSGELIGALDDGDLRLERLKWSTLRQQMVSELREARASNDRAEVSIITSKIEQADAELELVDEQLTRTRLTAPFDGIVIEGDLSQRLGTPVQRGDELFMIAPLDDYRIVLKIDEKDIAPIKVGMTGRLVLASRPDKPVAIRVTRVTPVSSAERGRNYFRVEASPATTDQTLQPGMEGVGKVSVGEARLFFIWTRELTNWLRLKTWTWWR